MNGSGGTASGPRNVARRPASGSTNVSRRPAGTSANVSRGAASEPVSRGPASGSTNVSRGAASEPTIVSRGAASTSRNASTDGLGDLEEAYAWDRKKIITHLENIVKDPSAYCTNDEYIKKRPQQRERADRNGKKGKLFPDNRNTCMLEDAAEILRDMAENKSTFDLFADKVGLTFEGVELPDNTAYDILGWLLSVTNSPPEDATPRMYYLRMVALYGKWCAVLAGSPEKTPTMVHLSWFANKDGKIVLLLGSTIGKIPDFYKALTVINDRQRKLHDLGFRPTNTRQLVSVEARNSSPDPSEAKSGETEPTEKKPGVILIPGVRQDKEIEQREDPAYVDGVYAGRGFGICAETFFYIVAVGLGGEICNGETVKGLALRANEISSIEKFQETGIKDALADPCEISCQKLIPQLMKLSKTGPWDWKKIFGVQKLKTEIERGASAAPGPAPAVASSSSRNSINGPVRSTRGTRPTTSFTPASTSIATSSDMRETRPTSSLTPTGTDASNVRRTPPTSSSTPTSTRGTASNVRRNRPTSSSTPASTDTTTNSVTTTQPTSGPAPAPGLGTHMMNFAASEGAKMFSNGFS